MASLSPSAASVFTKCSLSMRAGGGRCACARHAPPRTTTHRHAPPRTATHHHAPPRTVTHRHAPPCTPTHRHAPPHESRVRASGSALLLPGTRLRAHKMQGWGAPPRDAEAVGLLSRQSAGCVGHAHTTPTPPTAKGSARSRTNAEQNASALPTACGRVCT